MVVVEVEVVVVVEVGVDVEVVVVVGVVVGVDVVVGMTKAERQYLNRVAELGCLICERSAQIHHPRFGQGGSQRAPNWLAIPLCPEHHQGTAKGDISVHGTPDQFKNFYGSELNLLAETIKRLNT